jgi:hypothetical protein
MADDDDDLFDDDDAGLTPEDGAGGGAGGGGPGALGISKEAIFAWLTRRRGWVLIVGLAIAQGMAAGIMMYLRSEATPVAEVHTETIRDLAVDMLGYEVKIGQIYQLIPMRGGKRMTVGLDMVLLLGQLPEEQIEGAPRPDADEQALFIAAIQAMEPGIRSRVNILLQKIPARDYGSAQVLARIKEDVRGYVNDTLDGLDFGGGLRPELSKRRVTEVLLPMFIRQML